MPSRSGSKTTQKVASKSTASKITSRGGGPQSAKGASQPAQAPTVKGNPRGGGPQSAKGASKKSK
jgi:hypothetical protein